MGSTASSRWVSSLLSLTPHLNGSTHRLTTARFTDAIHVFEQGRIVESGSHQELLARGGRYAQSWRQQMRHVGQAPADGDSAEFAP